MSNVFVALAEIDGDDIVDTSTFICKDVGGGSYDLFVDSSQKKALTFSVRSPSSMEEVAADALYFYLCEDLGDDYVPPTPIGVVSSPVVEEGLAD